MTPAQELREIITRAGWSKKEAAERLSSSLVTIYRYFYQAEADDGNVTEQAKQARTPSAATVKLARILGAING